MRLYDRLTPIGAPYGSAVALGFFDGVHLGHRRVLRAAVDWAGEHGAVKPAVFTFRLPASAALKGARLLSDTQKQARMASLGIEEYLEPRFEDFCALTPEQFVEEILLACFRARAVFCGDNFTFGARAAGNVALLRQLCAAHGIEVYVVPMAEYGGQTVSSTRIRAALAAGDIAATNAMLGAPYAVDWPVTHGKGIGTSRLGTPTINQNYPAGMLVPCGGVYLTRILLDGQWWPAATGIGPRPTVDVPGAAVTCETHVMGFSGSVYGQAPLLEFHQYYCPTRKFDNLQQLHDLILQAGRDSQTYFSAQTPQKS